MPRDMERAVTGPIPMQVQQHHSRGAPSTNAATASSAPTDRDSSNSLLLPTWQVPCRLSLTADQPCGSTERKERKEENWKVF